MVNIKTCIKITKISLNFKRLLIFVILYSLRCKIEGHAVLIRKDQGNFCVRKSKKNSIINENVLISDGSLMQYQVYLFILYGKPEENSSYFSNV